MGEILSGERRLTAPQLLDRVSKAASGFAQLGLGAGETVALFLRNDFSVFEASFAAVACNAYPVMINWHCTEEEAQYLFNDCGAKIIVTHADLFERIQGAVPGDATVLIVATPPEIQEAYGLSSANCEVPAGLIDWEKWRDEQDLRAEVSLGMPSTIIYTSGTTGRPKGVKRAMPAPEQAERWKTMAFRGFGFMGHLDQPSAIVTVISGPMYHAAPNAYALMAVLAGAQIILQPRFHAEELLGLIQSRSVTHIHMVPIMFNRLLKLSQDVRDKYDLSSLKFVVHAAAPCPPDVKQAMIDWWGPVINEYYGSSETGMITFCRSDEAIEFPGTVGRPVEGAAVRIIDGNGRPLPAGEVGEIICALQSVADFTYHGDDAKRQATDKQGLVALGDVGFLNDEGYLFICDRANDMIISGGVNIYPAEIEAALHNMAGIADCAVFGIPDDEFGESVHAVIQLHADARLTESEIKNCLKEHITGFKVPKTIDFASDLPREDSGKIFKRKLRDPYWKNAERRI